MAHERIAPGTTGPIAIVPLGVDRGDPGRKEVVLPRSKTDGGEELEYPKGLKVGQSVKVELADGIHEFEVTRWRALALVADVDGKTYQVQYKRATKAAAETAARRAGEAKLAALARAREATDAPDGTTVGELLARWRTGLHDPANRLHESTKDDYEATIRLLLGEDLRPLRDGRQRRRTPEQMAMAEAFAPVAVMRPADVDARTLKDMFRAIADTNGKGSALRARAILAHVWDLAMEDRKLGVQVNMVRALRGESPRRVRRLQRLGRLESCREIQRGGTRRSSSSGRSGWSRRSRVSTSRSGRR